MPNHSGQRGLTRPKAQWYERGGGARRLVHDKALIAASYPNLSYQKAADGQMLLVGELNIEVNCGIITKVPIRIEFSADYPSSEPCAYDIGDQFEHIPDRHFFNAAGLCCLWLYPDSRWQPDDLSGLANFLTEVAVFFHRQLIYDVTRVWPGPARSHGAKGYQEFMCEMLGGDEKLMHSLAPVFADVSTVGPQSPCPCGSGRLYGICHHSKVREIERRVGKQFLVASFLPIVDEMVVRDNPVLGRLLLSVISLRMNTSAKPHD